MSSLLSSPPERSWSARRALAGIGLAGALPAAMLLVAIFAVPIFAGARSATAETLFLAVWATAVFAPLSFLEAARRPVFAALALAVTALVCTLPSSGGLRPVAVAGALALAVAILAAVTFTRRPAPGIRSLAALALAAAMTLHGHRLFLDGFSGATLVWIALLPAAAAALAARLAAAGRPGAGLAAALALLAAPQLASEPWWIEAVFATAGLAASFGSGVAATFARRGLFLFGAATLFAGGFPWLRSAPVATLLEGAVDVGRSVAESPLHERVVVLSEASPRFATELAGTRIRSLVIDSYLTNGVDLACGRALARLETTEGPAAAPWRATLVVGRDSAEWAAGRPDVAARLACPAPAPWISWIPAAGRFLGQTTRTRFVLDAPRATRSLVIERDPGLPAETTLALFFLATER